VFLATKTLLDHRLCHPSPSDSSLLGEWDSGGGGGGGDGEEGGGSVGVSADSGGGDGEEGDDSIEVSVGSRDRDGEEGGDSIGVSAGGGKNEFGFLLPAIEVVAGGVTAHGRWVGGTGATVARQKHEEGGAEASDTSRQSG
jgi:hypothetical protein